MWPQKNICSIITFLKLCQLEAKHGVDIGTTYTNEAARRSFVHFMAETKRGELINTRTKADFFSLLLDGSTNKGNTHCRKLVRIATNGASANIADGCLKGHVERKLAQCSLTKLAKGP